MIKKNKWQLIASSIVTLLPTLLGFFGKHLLPAEIAVHWGLDGQANGWMNSSGIFFLLPAILLAFHWLCHLLVAHLDPNASQNPKVTAISFWLIPVISLASCGCIFVSAMGHTALLSAFIYLALGIPFMIIGNYMPKTTRNVTMGIKIKWTLASDENWNATHRFAGKVYFVIGLLCLLCIPLPSKAFPYVAISIISCGVLLPVLYSYLFYKKQLTEGKTTVEEAKKSYHGILKSSKKGTVGALIGVGITLLLIPIILFTGKLETTLGDDALTVKASYWSNLTLSYDDIDSIEYRVTKVDGQRINGVGSAKLLLGTFKNDEFGVYTRYTYTKDTHSVVLKANGKTIVISTGDEQQTRALYERISIEISKRKVAAS